MYVFICLFLIIYCNYLLLKDSENIYFPGFFLSYNLFLMQSQETINPSKSHSKKSKSAKKI